MPKQIRLQRPTEVDLEYVHSYLAELGNALYMEGRLDPHLEEALKRAMWAISRLSLMEIEAQLAALPVNLKPIPFLPIQCKAEE